MRTFIAIDLPKDIRQAIAGIQEQLKSSGADVKWVAPLNIHLTLKFLGEAEEKELEKISKAIEDTCNSNLSFKILISCIGAFPKIDFPRVIWLGIDSGDSETKKIAKELEVSLAAIGFQKEDRPFSSHITLGRVKSNLNRVNLVQNIRNIETKIVSENLGFRVSKIKLYKSTLTPKGPVYEVLQEATLRAT